MSERCKRVGVMEMIKEYPFDNDMNYVLDFSDVWIVDFRCLSKYEKFALMYILKEFAMGAYFIRVLYARYGAGFINIFSDLVNACFHEDDNVDFRIMDGRLCYMSYVKGRLYEEGEIQVPWFREELLIPYPEVSYREEIETVVLTGIAPAAETRRIYIA